MAPYIGGVRHVVLRLIKQCEKHGVPKMRMKMMDGNIDATT
jgi:hypothetical protein